MRHRIVKVIDRGAQFDIETRSTLFNKRYAFIGANGLPDYAAASDVQRESAFISASTGLMSDGTGAYLII